MRRLPILAAALERTLAPGWLRRHSRTLAHVSDSRRPL